MYTDSTVPFASLFHLQTHFDLHGHEFGATTEEDYERMADAFMSQAPHANLHDGVCLNPRDNGFHDRLRLHGVTRDYGIAYDVLTIRSFYNVRRGKIARAGGPRAFINQKILETF